MACNVMIPVTKVDGGKGKTHTERESCFVNLTTTV